MQHPNDKETGHRVGFQCHLIDKGEGRLRGAEGERIQTGC